ncbi:hypothetical protein KCU85_g437, partial [Aureobasidium melanogenum]
MDLVVECRLSVSCCIISYSDLTSCVLQSVLFLFVLCLLCMLDVAPWLEIASCAFDQQAVQRVNKRTIDVLATSVAAHREWARKTDTFELRCSAVGLLLSCNSASIKVRTVIPWRVFSNRCFRSTEKVRSFLTDPKLSSQH